MVRDSINFEQSLAEVGRQIRLSMAFLPDRLREECRETLREIQEDLRNMVDKMRLNEIQIEKHDISAAGRLDDGYKYPQTKAGTTTSTRIQDIAYSKSRAQYREGADQDDYALARDFLSKLFYTPPEDIPEDAVVQLIDAFSPALEKIISRRNNGGYRELWKDFGWRGALYELHKNAKRLWSSYWAAEPGNVDHAVDLLNYAGFFIRAVEDDNEWGIIGPPSTTPSDDEVRDTP